MKGREEKEYNNLNSTLSYNIAILTSPLDMNENKQDEEYVGIL